MAGEWGFGIRAQFIIPLSPPLRKGEQKRLAHVVILPHPEDYAEVVFG